MDYKKQDAIQKLSKAALAMREAVKALQEIKDDPAMNHFIGPDAAYYRAQLEELLSCDDGEAGLEPFIDALAKKYMP